MIFSPRSIWKTCLFSAGYLVSAWGEQSDISSALKDTLERSQKSIHSRKAISTSNSQVIRDRDLSLRVMTDPADIIKVTPGLFTGQHAGGGKANQFFIRGFDADHGTDLALWFQGMPVNMVSHGHGQGFADLHFVIPELVDRVEVDKGPYNIEYGDFNTAGPCGCRLETIPRKIWCRLPEVCSILREF